MGNFLEARKIKKETVRWKYKVLISIFIMTSVEMPKHGEPKSEICTEIRGAWSSTILQYPKTSFEALD